MLEAGLYRRLLDAEGPDRLRRLGRILQAVEACGSLHRATASLGISYRQAWGLLRRVEDLLGQPLLTRRTGGARGGGADLTPLAQGLLIRQRHLQDEVEQILARPEADDARPVLVASTIGPVEAGLLDLLEAAFHSRTGLWVRHIGAGSGQALEIARSGKADLVLAHSPQEEEAFVANGWGIARYPLMTSRFLICGPLHDPAGTAAAPSAVAAMKLISAHGSLFLSRGDQSGTHRREEALWLKAGVRPGPPWYRIHPQGALGSVATLREAERLGAYTLADEAAFGRLSPAGLKPLYRGETDLENLFSLIALNPDRLPGVNHSDARQFITWATGDEGQQVIARSAHFCPILLQAAVREQGE